MSKPRIDQSNPRTVARLIKEGRGQGHREDYRPWLQPRDVPSLGTSSRGRGWRSKTRVVSTLSGLERDWVYTLEWNPQVADIREQYPLELGETQRLAVGLGLRHPNKQGKDTLMSSDVEVTWDDDTRTAYQVKPLAMLKNPRTVEKLKIEAAYWKVRGVPWKLVTEREMNPVLIRNVRRIHPFFFDDAIYPYAGLVETVHARVTPCLAAGVPLLALCTECDQALKLKAGATLKLTYHLIAHRRWPVDFSVPMNVDQPLRLLTL